MTTQSMAWLRPSRSYARSTCRAADTPTATASCRPWYISSIWTSRAWYKGPHRLMYLVLPLKSKPGVTSSFHRHMRYRLHEPKFWLEPNHSGGIAGTCSRPVLWRIGKSDPKRVWRTGPPTLGCQQRRQLERCQHEGRPSVTVVSVKLYFSLIRVHCPAVD